MLPFPKSSMLEQLAAVRPTLLIEDKYHSELTCPCCSAQRSTTCAGERWASAAA